MSGSAFTIESQARQHVASSTSSIAKPPRYHPATTILQGRKSPREVEPTSIVGPEPFFIRTHPHSHLDQPTTAWPQLLLPRVLLPLSFLEPQGRLSSIFRTRFITAEIKSLEPQNGQSNLGGHIVLIAKLLEEPVLCAIERVEDGIYSICRLASWVGLERVQQLANIGVNTPTLKKLGLKRNAEKWWSDAEVPEIPVQVAGPQECKTTTANFPGSVACRDPIPLDSTSSAQAISQQHTPVRLNEDSTDASLMVEKEPVVEEVYANIITQYLDNLYLSKTSLAYFAKGPLSRARADCGMTTQASTDQLSLPEFLRSLILGVTSLDKKYKESIPTTVKKLNPVTQDDKTTDTAARPSKRRKFRKLKPGKDGLLPGEDDVIAKWWIDNDREFALGASIEASLLSRLARLRFRETLLQLVMILEVLAIEASAAVSKSLAKPIETGGIDEANANLVKNVKARKTQDLHAMIETLVDRLSIWQSIETMDDTGKDLDNDSAPPSGVTTEENNVLSVANHDQLKEFYTEVVLPFYAARLPGLMSKLARRFGASAGRPPPKRKAKSSAGPGQALVLGSELPTTHAEKPRQSLIRVATDSSRPTAQPPALMRSATDPLVHGVKREKSATPRLSFDYKEERRPLSRSSSISQAKMLNHREVDFGFISKFNETKAKRKVDVEQELQEAISTLKKPNRGLAVKELVDAADSRKLANRLNRATNVIQRRPGLGVQVNATPHRLKKSRDVFSDGPASEQIFPGITETIPSSNPCIPASAIRSSSYSSAEVASRKLPVADTPSRGGQKFSQPVSESATSQGSQGPRPRPLSSSSFRDRIDGSGFKVPAPKEVPKSRPASNDMLEVEIPVFNTPMKSRNECQAEVGLGESDIMDTPSRKLGFGRLPSAPLAQSQSRTGQVEGSIYDALGWNDGNEIDDVM